MNLLRRSIFGFAALITLVAGSASAGVGVWTTNGPTNTLDSGPVVVDPKIPGTVYVGTQTGIAKSTNNGGTWSATDLSDQTPALPLAAANGSVYRSFGSCVSLLPPQCSTTVEKSVDGGGHWADLFTGSNVSYGITIDPTNPSTLYRASTVGFLLGSHTEYVGSFHRSTDGGVSWTEIDQGLGSNVITAVTIDPKNPATLYPANVPEGFQPILPGPPSNLFKSNDAGSTWTLLTTTLGPIQSLVLDPMTPTTVYAAGGSGIFKSIDGGSTFLLVNSTFAGEDGQLRSLVIDPRHSNRLYGANGHGVFQSSDAAVTWTPINNGLTGRALSIAVLVIDSTGGYLHATPTYGGIGVFDYQIVTDPGVLTLNAVHPFSITLTATDQRTGRSGPGVATQWNDLWGYFSIPAITNNPNNPEVFVKMLNAMSVNESYWFFYGGLTDLGYTLTVKEDATGLTKTYAKPAGSECGGSDTAAFGP